MTQLHIAVREGRKAVIPTTEPVVFSAGPIRNSRIWQNDAMRFGIERDADVFFASPLRDTGDFDHDLSSYLAPFTGQQNFPRQRAWEQYYLDQAGLNREDDDGCVFFWLEKPLPRAEWTFPEKQYAQITMYELGQWVIRKQIDPRTRLVIGADKDFPELSTLLFDIETTLGENFIVHGTLQGTVNAAIDIALAGKAT